MTLEKMGEINKVVEKIIKENPNLFQKKSKNWYLKRKYFLEENEEFLELVSKELETTKEELFYMQKLFLEYPISPPERLLSISWENIKCILDLCEEEKRKFYIDVCYFNEIEEKKLKELIQKDLYEKVLVILTEIKENKSAPSQDFLDKILEILPMIWQ